MTHDSPEGVVRFINGTDEVAYKMPYMIEQYNSLSNLEKEHTKSVYLRNEEDKRIGVEYVMSKILGFYKECLELGPEYETRMDDEGEVTFFSTILVLLLNTLNALLLVEYPTKNPSSAFPSNLPRRAQEGNPSIKRSKLDRSYARGASAVQVTRSLDLMDGLECFSLSSFDSDIPVTTTTSMVRPLKGPLSTYEVGGPSSVASASVFSARYELNQLRQDFGILRSHVQSLTRDRFIWEMSFVVERDIPELMNDSTTIGDRLTLLEQDQVKNREEIQRLKNQVQAANISATVAAMDRDRIEKTQDQDGKQIQGTKTPPDLDKDYQELYWRGFEENRPTESIDVLATYGDADPPELQEPSDTQ
ncbi:hypothetical protein Tco_1136392 [Tanacetum coccineum]